MNSVTFDSANVSHSHSFAIGVPMSWDEIAEDAWDMDAISAGFLFSRRDEPSEALPVEVAAQIEVEPIRSPRIATDGIPATATRVRFINYGTTNGVCVRYLEAWIEEETGRVRMTYERADELFRQGRVAILPDKPEPIAFRGSKPTPKPAPKVVTEDQRYASRLAYLKIAQFNPDRDSNDWAATEALRQSRRSLVTA